MSDSTVPSYGRVPEPARSTSAHGRTVAVAATAVSSVCLVLLFLDVENAVTWFGWLLGWLVAFGAGPVAWEHGHVHDSRVHRLAGQLALGYVLAVVVLLIALF